jgi:hypothetical protein
MQHRARWWKQLMESPECTALRARTVCSPAVAEIAAAELAKQWVGVRGRASRTRPEDADDESAGGVGERMRSTRDALAEAAQAADMPRRSAQVSGSARHSLDTSKLAQYTRRLRMSTEPRGIMRMAGRFIAKAQRLQRQRTDLPGMEITGVELSGDLARLLPIESSLIAGAVPELELLALARLTQRRSLSYRGSLRTPGRDGADRRQRRRVGQHDRREDRSREGARARHGVDRARAEAAVPALRVGGQPEGYPHGLGLGPTRSSNGWKGLLRRRHRARWPAAHAPDDGVARRPDRRASDHIIITDDDVGLRDELLDEYQAWAKLMGVRTFGIGIGVATPTRSRASATAASGRFPSLDLDNPAVDVVLSIGPTHHEVRAA